VATLGAYAALVTLLTWPLAAHVATHLPRTKFNLATSTSAR